MQFIFYQSFGYGYVRDPIPEDTKIEIAKERAVRALAEHLVSKALVAVERSGDIRIMIDTDMIPEELKRIGEPC